MRPGDHERCGAWRGCLGLEPTPELYVRHLLAVLGEVHRVLREDGTLWLVLGDAFLRVQAADGESTSLWHLKEKDLVGLPWRVAFALQRRGWWLRSEIVWCKPNPMPESVADRPTRAHEYVLLLAKRPRYYYDALGVREPDCGGHAGNGYIRRERLTYRDRRGCRGQCVPWRGGGGRNRRSWWLIAARGYPGAQAAFPEKLVEPCILAGSPPHACATCGAPFRRERGGRTWEPSCQHQGAPRRALVLDPFCGSGTTGVVARRLGRDFLGIEAGSETAALARGRIDSIGEEEKR